MLLRRPVPILRMFDLERTKRFYVEWLGFELQREEGDPADGPMFVTVQRDDVRIHLSSHHGDGTPGAVVLIPVDDVDALHAELHARPYSFMNPGIEPRGIGRELTVLDPASNQLRFFEPG
jgi:catechol 2,3-dioxygenase-like lactoylglutathione lyase family enzyme